MVEFIDNYIYSVKERAPHSNIGDGQEVCFSKDVEKDKAFFCLMLPDPTPYIDRVAAMLRLNAEMMGNTSLNVKEKGGKTEHGVEVEFTNMLRTFGRFMGYLVNCTSYREGKVQEFDKQEFAKRLEQLKIYFQ